MHSLIVSACILFLYGIKSRRIICRGMKIDDTTVSGPHYICTHLLIPNVCVHGYNAAQPEYTVALKKRKRCICLDNHLHFCCSNLCHFVFYIHIKEGKTHFIFLYFILYIFVTNILSTHYFVCLLIEN